jgi:hypothetical protein
MQEMGNYRLSAQKELGYSTKRRTGELSSLFSTMAGISPFPPVVCPAWPPTIFLTPSDCWITFKLELRHIPRLRGHRSRIFPDSAVPGRSRSVVGVAAGAGESPFLWWLDSPVQSSSMESWRDRPESQKTSTLRLEKMVLVVHGSAFQHRRQSSYCPSEVDGHGTPVTRRQSTGTPQRQR